MKFRVTFKTPDALDYAIKDMNGSESCGAPECGDNGNPSMCVDCEYSSDLVRDAEYEARALADKFIRYGECVTVEFDTDAKTCVVVPASK